MSGRVAAVREDGMKVTDELIEKAAKAIDPWAFRELSHSDLMSDDYANTRQRHAQERARKTARAALEAVMPGEDKRLWPNIDAANAIRDAVNEALARYDVPSDVYEQDILIDAACVRLADKLAHPAPEPGENERLREAHRENIRLLGLVAHDLTGRVEGGKVAAIYTAINNARAALAEGGSDE